MPYGALADLVVIAHFAFIVFAIAGGLLARRWRRMAWLHLPALGWAAHVTLAGRICPLTPLEQALRQRAGQPSYEGDFVEQYIVPLVYAGDLGRDIQIGLGVLLLAANVIVYTAVWRRTPHGRLQGNARRAG
jgi:hypothetical protein